MSAPVTTLAAIRAHHPCSDGWTKLLAGLGKTQADDEPLPLLSVLDLNGTDDALWCVDRLYAGTMLPRLIAADFAEMVLPIFEAERPDDPCPREAIRVARDPSATPEQLAAAGAAAGGRRRGRRRGRRMGQDQGPPPSIPHPRRSRCGDAVARNGEHAMTPTYTASTMPRDEAAVNRMRRAADAIQSALFASSGTAAERLLARHDAQTIARLGDLNARIIPNPEADASLIETLRAEIAQLRADASDTAMRADRAERAAEVMRKALNKIGDNGLITDRIYLAEKALSDARAIYAEAAQ